MADNVPPPGGGVQGDQYGSWAQPTDPPTGFAGPEASRSIDGTPKITIAKGFDSKLQTGAAASKEQSAAIKDMIDSAETISRYMRDGADSAKEIAGALSEALGLVTSMGGEAGGQQSGTTLGGAPLAPFYYAMGGAAINPMAAGGMSAGGMAVGPGYFTGAQQINPGGGARTNQVGTTQIPSRNIGGGSYRSEGGTTGAGSDRWIRSGSEARHYSFSNLKGDVRRTLGKKLSQVGTGPQMVKRADDGRFLNAATGEELGGFQRAVYQGSAVARNIGGGLSKEPGAAGSGLIGGLMSAGGGLGTAGMALGGATAAIGLGLEARSRWRDIYQSLTPYEQVGYSTTDALGQKLGEEDFKARQFFDPTGLSGADASRLYLGTLQAGYRGADLSEARAFGVQNYKQYGTSIEDTLKILRTAAAGGQRELTGVAAALDQVATAARNSTQNVGEAQAIFTGNYQTLNGAIGAARGSTSGALAPSLASAVTQFQTSLPPGLRNQFNLGAILQDPNLSMLFSQGLTNPQTGQGFGSIQQFAGWAAKNPGLATQVFGQGIQNLAQRTGAGALGITPQALQQWAQGQGIKGNTLNPGQINQFIDQLQQQNPQAPYIASQLLAQQGQNVQPGDALRLLIGEATAGGTFNRASQNIPGGTPHRGAPTTEAGLRQVLAETPNRPNVSILSQSEFNKNKQILQRAGYSLTAGQRLQQAGGGDLQIVNADGSTGAKIQASVAQQLVGNNPSSVGGGTYQQYLTGLLRSATGTDTYNGGGVFGQTQSQRVSNASRAYLHGVPNFGTSGNIESLLASGADVDAQYVVQTAGGKRKVNFLEAVSNYRDQLERGTAEFATGQYAGQTVGSVTGQGANPVTKNTPNTAKKKATRGSKWTNQDQNQLNSDANTGAMGGSITISASPDLQRFLRIQAQGSNLEVTNAINGTPSNAYPPDPFSYSGFSTGNYGTNHP